MGSHSFIFVALMFAITVEVAFAQTPQTVLESFRTCIRDQGLPSDLVVHRCTGNSSLYAQLDHRWNLRPVHTHPLAYFVPRVVSDVQVAVRCARANNIPVIPKSGGHSAELLAFGNAGTIVIAFQSMKKIEINASDKTAVIESGALMGEIRETLLNQGELGLSGGICAYVGISGLALGGGDGHTTSIHNLAVDNILEMEMVDANGDLHLVNENVNADLFWALRGVGPGYIGIVTSLKFKLFNTTDLRTTRMVFNYRLDQAGPVFLAYQEWLIWAENEGLNARCLMTVDGLLNLVRVTTQLLEEISTGQPTNAERFLNKAIETFPPDDDQNVTLTFPSYAELMNIDDEMHEENPSINADPPRYVKKKSFFVNRSLSADELENVVQLYSRAGNLPVWVYHFGFTGRVNKIPAAEMSYVHRGHLYLVSHRVLAPPHATVEAVHSAHMWLNEYVREAHILDSGASYQNYVDLDESDSFMERYYGVHSQRLIEIKSKWDPENYFQSRLSIPISKVAANMADNSLIVLKTSFLCIYLLGRVIA